jgi:acetamidase/formamidase
MVDKQQVKVRLAYMIASVAVYYHVTQVVDGTKGIRGMIPKSIFTTQ